MPSLTRQILCLPIAFCLVTFPQIYCQSIHSQFENPPSSFKNQYAFLGINRNFPISRSLSQLEPSIIHPHIGYGHILTDQWFLNIQLGFRFIQTRPELVTNPMEDRKIAFLTIGQESLSIFRISRPIYMLTGPSLLYILPTRKGMIPMDRKQDYLIEIGAGWSMWFAYIQDYWLSAIRIERWRGTYTNRIHAMQVSLVTGIGF